MKKLNRKGFAISTVIYGLSIMGIMIVAILLATMSQNRSNVSQLAKSIEDDLNRFSRTETAFKAQVDSNNLPSAQEYIVPETAWYRVELWGSKNGNGGNGAYTSGIIKLEEGEIIYFYVGNKNGSEADVRKVAGSYDDSNSYTTRFMVASGGGTGTNADGGTLVGYSNRTKSNGGYIKVTGDDKDFSLLPKTDADNDTNGTLIGLSKNYTYDDNISYRKLEFEFAVSDMPILDGDLTVPSPRGSNGGGDGIIPSNSANYGGVSYIAGYAGCYGIKQGQFTYDPLFDYYVENYNAEDGTTYGESIGKYYFVDGMMLPGVNEGEGHAKITKVYSSTNDNPTLPRKNTKLDNVKYIRDCVTSPSGYMSSYRIITVKDGVADIRVPIGGSGGCYSAELESVKSIDEIAVFHSPGQDYIKHKISVSADRSNWTVIKSDDGGDLTETATPNGVRISAYKYDTTGALPKNGNYIILPVLSENKVVTAGATAENNADPISIEYYNGYNRQIWNIELIEDSTINNGNTNEYKIVELARFKALAIAKDENLVFNTLSAVDSFNKYARNDPQIWKITNAGNGTYYIQTVVTSSNGDSNVGYLVPQTNQKVNDAKNQIIIGKKNQETTRFKLIPIDY